MKTDYENWVELIEWLKEVKAPKGEHCFLGRECRDGHGRNSFYVNTNGIAISKSRNERDLHNFEVELDTDFGYPAKKIIKYDFNWRPTHQTLTEDKGMNRHLVEEYVNRFNHINVAEICADIRRVMQETLDDIESYNTKKKLDEIEQKERELAKLKGTA